jgi:predicted HicB family RNase H-like nuclease
MSMKAFVIRIDEKLWEKFTIKCIKNRKSKNEVIINFIKEYVNEK